MLPLPQAPQVCLPASVLAAAASYERAWPLRKEPPAWRRAEARAVRVVPSLARVALAACEQLHLFRCGGGDGGGDGRVATG